MGKHEKIIIAFLASTVMHKTQDVLQIGDALVSEGAEALIDGGFWIWDILNEIEFYSPKFRHSLGFENEKEFPSVPASWMAQIKPEDKYIAISNFNKHVKTGGVEPYHQIVEYSTKKGKKIMVVCSGTILNNAEGKPIILIGTHKIL